MMKKATLLLAINLLLSPFASACEDGSTLLVARQDASFSQRGDSWTQEFSISGNDVQTLVLRFASVYRATAIIINAVDAEAFRNGSSVSYYKGFDNNFGTNSVNLAAGNYALAIRNNNEGQNNYSVELDCDKTFADSTRVNSHTEAETVSANGGKLWQPLDVSAGYRLWVDGTNYGLETYLIPEGELSAFQNNNTFKYYEDFSSTTSGGFPGGYEINLPAGRYYLAFLNSETVAMPLTYTLELFEIIGDGNNGGVAIDGQSSFSIADNQLSAEIASVTNTRNSNTAPLRLLWLASTDGTFDNIYTIAKLDLDTLDNGDGSLAVGSSFKSITLATDYQQPPYGTYRIILAVVETSHPDQVLDSVTYDSTHTLGTPGVSNRTSSQALSSTATSRAVSSTANSQAASSMAASSIVAISSRATSSAVGGTGGGNGSGGGGGGGGAFSWFGLLFLSALALLGYRSKAN